jgi:hypothetical protein
MCRKKRNEHDIMENVGYLQCVERAIEEKKEMNGRRSSFEEEEMKQSPPLKQIKKLSSKQKEKDVLMA